MKEFENGTEDGIKAQETSSDEEIKRSSESKIKLWPGLKPEDLERYRNQKKNEENSNGKNPEIVVLEMPKAGAEHAATEEPLEDQKPDQLETKIQEETAAESYTRDVSELEEKRQRKPHQNHYRISTKTLYIILGILCIILAAALVGQEYYLSTIYEKGELAQLAQEKVRPRRRFMKEENLTEEVLTEEISGETVSENTVSGMEAKSGDGSDMASETGSTGNGIENIGETLPENSVKTVVETSESINLKHQLIGVLPGIMQPGQTSAELIEQADLLAAMYDYDGAVALLENCSSYEQDLKMQKAVEGYKATKATCVEYPVDQITHVFFHTLIKDPEKAFDGDQHEDEYNQNMVTIDEFNCIIQQMYDKGYVMVTLEDMAPEVVNEDGSVSLEQGKILLPQGKIPFVLSQDDVSYYHYMDGDGFASKLIIDENGKVKNEYMEDDGSISVGDYDMVPLIDTFVDAHPDFSYQGAKGYIALTGYDGILGYRTDICYKTRENLTNYQAQFFEEHPDFSEADYERECEESKKVAEAMKAEGWLFASHTWGHVGLGEGSTTIQQFKTDVDKWEERVEPLIGETDTIIYALGGDIGGSADYSGQRFDYLKSVGFNYFCGIDSAAYWVQLRDNYMRQARRNIDGYRMYYNPDMLSDLFDVSQVWDPKRPETVPPI